MSRETTYKKPQLQVKPKHPYFQFTDGCYSACELYEWLEHFRALEIPAAIIKLDVRGNKPYSLWRIGIQACTYPNWKILGAGDLIVEEVHNFSEVAYGTDYPR